jgi:hypothetical protein
MTNAFLLQQHDLVDGFINVVEVSLSEEALQRYVAKNYPNAIHHPAMSGDGKESWSLIDNHSSGTGLAYAKLYIERWPVVE